LRITGRENWRGAFTLLKIGLLFGMMMQIARHHDIMGHETGNAMNVIILER
jgi:hypothetical protein